MATADGTVPPDGDRAAAKPPSKACMIKSLRKELLDKQQVCNRLKQENNSLRTREEVLLQQVTQQGDNLHFVALAAAQAQSATPSNMPDMAKSLLQDMEVHVLMGMLGRPDSSGQDAPLTTQWLRAAVTPERVAAMRSMTLEQVAATLKQLTMRMCMLLMGGSDKAHLYSQSLEAAVNEYGQFGLLLHVAADRVNHQIGTLNLDTLQVQEPPPGYWENVADSIELDQQQMQTLATGFNSYQQKAKPVIAAMHAVVSKIRGILEASEGSDGTQSQVASSTAGTEQQPDEQGGQEHTSMLNDSGEVQQPGCAGDVAQQPRQQQQAKCGEQPEGQQVHQGMQQQQQPKQGMHPQQQQQHQTLHQQQHQSLLQELLQQGASMEAWGDAACSHEAAVSAPMPWQQFGLSHGCLTIETAEVLEGHMTELMQHVMKLREMHRTVTWLFLNVLSHRQHMLVITAAWPWWTQPLPMCQYIAEKHQQQQKSKPTRPNRRAPVPVRFDSYATGADAVAATVADDVWRAQYNSQAMTGPAQLRGSTIASEDCDVLSGTALS